MTRTIISLSLSVILLSTTAHGGAVDVRQLGAKPDGQTLCTQAIQKAIDQCAEQGGGTVVLGEGTWLSGRIALRTGVTLRLAAGAVLQGSRRPEDYDAPEGSKAGMALIVAEDVERVTICGPGTIDGSGDAYRDKKRRRPKNIIMQNCRDVLVEDVQMRASGSWMQHYRDCQRITVRNITVFNHVSFNNDGLDFDGCRDVTITGCTIDSDDDALVLKSLSLKPCENITIRDCTLSSHCNALKMGTESGGGFKNITASNCTIFSPRHSQVTYGRQRGLAGIALEIVDGGQMDKIDVSNVSIEGVTAPIFIRLGNRARQYGNGPKPGVGTLCNVQLSNITAKKCSTIGCAIAGLPDHPVQQITLRNVRLEFEGGEPREATARKIPERPEGYPESTMFGTLPAYGFYCRHAKGLHFENVSISTDQADGRHALVADDVEGLVLDGFSARYWPEAESMLRLIQSRDVTIRRCRPEVPKGTLLSVEGSESRGIRLTENDFSGVGTVVTCAKDVPADAVAQSGNKPAAGAK